MDAINFFAIGFIFILGSIFGSFFNVLLLRKNTGESVIFSSSRCFSCGTRLGVLDLIPIFSFLFSGGKCRYCGSKVAWQYPIVEIVVGIGGIMIYLKFLTSNFSFFTSFSWYFLAFSSLFLVAAYDFRNKIIDAHFLYMFGIFAAIEFVMRNLLIPAPSQYFRGWINDVASALIIALFFYLMWRFSCGRWMGRGDADMAFFTSLFLGFPLSVAGFFLAFWIGGFIGVTLLFFKKFNLKSEIPFGPFLALGAFCAWFFADAITAFYGIIW